MKDYFKRLFFTFVRWGRSYGFGVQSPFAFTFVTTVVNSSFLCDDYDRLFCRYKESKPCLILHRFYLRLSNSLKVNTWFFTKPTAIVNDYIRAGYNEAAITKDMQHSDVVVISLNDDAYFLYNVFYELALQDVSPSSVLIIEGIHKNKTINRFWKKVVEDNRTGVTFDLYYCGVVFFDLKKTKQNYKVMLKA